MKFIVFFTYYFLNKITVAVYTLPDLQHLLTCFYLIKLAAVDSVKAVVFRLSEEIWMF